MDFYFFSKMFWYVAEPSHLLVWAVVVGAIFIRLRLGRILIGLAAAGILVVMFVPLGDWAVTALENQYPRGPWPSHVDGVLELGGGLSGPILESRGVPGAPGASRVIATFELARRYPAARIVFSGGGNPNLTPEAVVARAVFDQLGTPPGRVLYESRSRDTWENFVFSQKLAGPKPGETWLVVTSAFHMPRAMAIARRVGWRVQPWPSDYTTTPAYDYHQPDFGGNLGNLDLAMHEWVGLLVYRFTGRAR